MEESNIIEAPAIETGNGEGEVATKNVFRTKAMNIIAFPWACNLCKHKGLMFDPAKVQLLLTKYEAILECPECKSVIYLEASSILTPDEAKMKSALVQQGVR